jgi:hypothetical protein
LKINSSRKTAVRPLGILHISQVFRIGFEFNRWKLDAFDSDLLSFNLDVLLIIMALADNMVLEKTFLELSFMPNNDIMLLRAHILLFFVFYHLLNLKLY